uniref:Pre-mRNA-splicing factor prp46 n=1 Tax=Lygus hesperus TaxID=30085 RepID=A0A146KZJ7_LYGHE
MIRNYHGHLSGIYTVQVHPILDLVFSGGRDSSIRVWDMRTKSCLRTLVGHRHTVTSLGIQGCEPQIVSGSQDTMIRLWDLRSSKTLQTLTHHKKSVRSICIHPRYNCFISASTDNIKYWKLPEGIFMRNAHHNHEEIVNEVCANMDGVVCAGSDSGGLAFFDWYSGYCYQILRTPPQLGSLQLEAGIFGVTFDQSGSRVLTCEADKTIKVYCEDEKATPETQPTK